MPIVLSDHLGVRFTNFAIEERSPLEGDADRSRGRVKERKKERKKKNIEREGNGARSRATSSMKHCRKKSRCSNKRNVEIYSLTFRIKGGRGSFKQICRWTNGRGREHRLVRKAVAHNASIKKFINTTPRCHREFRPQRKKKGHERARARLAVWNIA